MSDPADPPRLDTCRCCEVGPPPHKHYNRPGQPALSYRLGTHASFLRRLLARLPTETIPDGPNEGKRPLLQLTTRAGDDPAIALLDASATVLDVITFYQERIANEGYLLTATERRSVLDLARAIGYELNPGVAASTHLAFTVEEAKEVPGTAAVAKSAPTTAIVPKGTRVQSVPGPGEQAQTFETTEEIEARVEWNALRPRQTRPQYLAIAKDGNGEYVLYLVDPTASVEKGKSKEIKKIDDLYLVSADIPFQEGAADTVAHELDQVYVKGTTGNLKAGQPLLFVGKKRDSMDVETVVLPIRRVEVEPKLDRTRLDLEVRREGDGKLPPFVQPLLLVEAEVTTISVGFTAPEIKANITEKVLKDRDLNALLALNRLNGADVVDHVTAADQPKLPPIDQGAFALRQRTGFFGHNAPHWGSLPVGDNPANDPYHTPDTNWDAGSGRTVWQDYKGDQYSTQVEGMDVFLERSVSEIISDSWVVFESAGIGREAYRVAKVSEASIVGYGLSAKATGLALSQPDGTTPPDKSASFRVRATTAHVQSESQDLADLPIEDAVAKGTTELMLDSMVLELQAAQTLILGGELQSARGVTQHEEVVLDDVVHAYGYTTLVFRSGLKHDYVRETVTLNANVARTTHGETVHEILGSGDGTQANQRFALKRPPLTYVPARTPGGSESTLQVRVDGVLWKEVPSLYGLDEQSQSYIVRINDDREASLTFGPARLRTGATVDATYRSGTGPEGEVDAGSLTLLQTRPLGIREVTNPQEAGDAEAPESLEQARENAPLTVRTLDRIVSLKDFEDFARTFAGVGKAQAVALWDGQIRLVHITIASASGKEASLELQERLKDAIDEARDPVQDVRVSSFRPCPFYVKTKVWVDSRYVAASVLADIEAALEGAFAFARRAFGQAVTAAEVLTVIQKVKGVVAADLDHLHRATEPADYNTILPADTARLDDGKLQGAELLYLGSGGVHLEEMRE